MFYFFLDFYLKIFLFRLFGRVTASRFPQRNRVDEIDWPPLERGTSYSWRHTYARLTCDVCIDIFWSPFGSLWSVKQTVTSLAFKSCCSTREHIGFVATMRSFIIIDRSQSSRSYFEVNYSRCSLLGQYDWLLLQVVAPRPHRRAPASWRPATLPTQAQTEHGPG